MLSSCIFFKTVKTAFSLERPLELKHLSQHMESPFNKLRLIVVQFNSPHSTVSIRVLRSPFNKILAVPPPVHYISPSPRGRVLCPLSGCPREYVSHDMDRSLLCAQTLAECPVARVFCLVKLLRFYRTKKKGIGVLVPYSPRINFTQITTRNTSICSLTHSDVFTLTEGSNSLGPQPSIALFPLGE